MKKKKSIFATFKVPPKLKAPILLSILATFITSFIAASLIFIIQPVIPLMYTLALPEQQLVAKEWLLIFPAISFTINFIHLITINVMKNFRSVLILIFAWTTVLLQFLLLLAMLRIIVIIT